MSFALLLGLLANRLWGFWQADPVVGILIAAWLVREGVETRRTGELCSC
jgi:divalent metal cation (Fe/Co/Zn/Cd) transporter